jgi:hypothetical protein
VLYGCPVAALNGCSISSMAAIHHLEAGSAYYQLQPAAPYQSAACSTLSIGSLQHLINRQPAAPYQSAACSTLSIVVLF